MSDKLSKTAKLLREIAEVLVTFAGFIGALKTLGEAFLPQKDKEDET